MRLLLIHLILAQEVCDTISAFSSRSDRYPQSTARIPRGSAADDPPHNWPVQPTLFHTPRAYPQTRAIEEKYLHPVPSFVGEQEKMTARGILLKLADHKSIKAIETEPHIRRSGSHVDASGCAQAEHNYTSPRTAIRRRSVAPSNPAPTPIRQPPDSSTNKAVCHACCATGRSSSTSTGISETAGAVHSL